MIHDRWRALDWTLKIACVVIICTALWYSFEAFQTAVPRALARLDGMSDDAFRIYEPLSDFGANNIAVGLTLIPLFLGVRLIERRSFAELLLPDGRLRLDLFAHGFLIWVVAMTIVRVMLSATGLRTPLVVRLVPGFDTLLVVSLTFFIQAPAEELIFRGYLMSRLAALVPGRGALPALIGMVGNSAAFALLHFYHIAGTAQMFVLGLGCSLVRLIDRRLERAMGLHTALNIMIAVVFGLNGPSGPAHRWPSLMRLPPAPRADWIDVAGLLASLALMLALTYGRRIVLKRRQRRRA
jgi:membrane protease YdiL (CAAX protease family)